MLTGELRQGKCGQPNINIIVHHPVEGISLQYAHRASRHTNELGHGRIICFFAGAKNTYWTDPGEFLHQRRRHRQWTHVDLELTIAHGLLTGAPVEADSFIVLIRFVPRHHSDKSLREKRCSSGRRSGKYFLALKFSPGFDR